MNPENSLSVRPIYYFFSGKGGVGKTTLAAGMAVQLARLHKKVLVTSTDPAHSLSDVFDVSIGHQGVEIEPNLRALEIDSSARWAEATIGISGEESQSSSQPRGRMERTFSDMMRIMGQTPGVDEFISLELLLETMASDVFDAIVFDTAPTGHTLRLLTLPQMLDGWLGRLITLRSYFSKIGRVVRKMIPRSKRNQSPDLGENLLTAKDRIGQVQQLIKDSNRTRFTLVTIPEAMSVLETQRTIQQLNNQGIPIRLIIANQMQPVSDLCMHCKRRRTIHEKEIKHLESIVGEIPLHRVECQSQVIRGTDALFELGREIYPWLTNSTNRAH